MNKRRTAGSEHLAAPSAGPRHRSAAVARIAQIPVATLRVWQRRYQIAQPTLSAGGHRLYSDADIRRIALIKQLKQRGHAVGSLAPLDLQQLLAIGQLGLHSPPEPAPASGLGVQTAPWRVAVVGPVWGERLQRPMLARQLRRPLVLLGHYESTEQAEAGLQGQELDAILIHAPVVGQDWLGRWNGAAPSLNPPLKALLYEFASEAVCETLASAGFALLRAPQSDVALGQWLHQVGSTAPVRPVEKSGSAALPPRRWSDAQLVQFGTWPSGVPCECPRQLAQLLQQLANFEAYSSQCSDRDARDADLHDYLRQVAGSARARFEHALERVALHEGLPLPDQAGPNAP